MANALSIMLHPKSIAIIGASPNANKLNGLPFHFLQRDGYTGVLYPVNPKYAELMLDGLQGYAILEGARGKSKVGRHALIKMICDLSLFALAHPEVVELDLNLVFADNHGVIVVDWMMARATPGAKNREAAP